MKKQELIFDQNYDGTIMLSKVSKLYGTNGGFAALNNVSLQLFMGQVVVILGASGSGKSTLLNLIGGMDRASSGEIVFADVDIASLPDKTLARYRREVVGFIFQNYNLMPNLSTLENVEISELSYGMKAIDALKLVGLEDKEYSFPSQLSGGEQQRVAIARALVKNPKILLCDEPTGALDSQTSKNVIQAILDINKNKDKIILIVTHNSTIAEVADRVIKLSDGKIVSDVIQKNPKKLEEIEF